MRRNNEWVERYGPALVAAVFGGTLVVLLPSAIADWRRSVRVQREPAVAAVVVDVREVETGGRGDSTTNVVHVEFTDAAGMPRRARVDAPGEPHAEVGDTTAIRFDPADPGRPQFAGRPRQTLSFVVMSLTAGPAALFWATTQAARPWRRRGRAARPVPAWRERLSAPATRRHATLVLLAAGGVAVVAIGADIARYGWGDFRVPPP